MDFLFVQYTWNLVSVPVDREGQGGLVKRNCVIV